MTESYYRIADIPVLVRRDRDRTVSLFNGFEAEENVCPQVIAEIYEGNRNFQKCYGIEYCVVSPEYLCVMSSQKYPAVHMLASSAWDRLVIEGCKDAEEGMTELFLAGLYSYASLRGNILMHASAVEWKGEGIIFTAASGTGKTTQAKLWEKYKHAKILNGDKIFLECIGKSCSAWGIPWKGSSPYALNKKTHLKAVIVLEQAKVNSIHRLEGVEALSRVSPHLFYPSWDVNCTKAVMDAYSRMIEQTPVYLLSCLPDREAVDITCDKIWGDQLK